MRWFALGHSPASSPSPGSPPRARAVFWPKKNSRKLIFASTYVVFLGALLWFAQKAYWRLAAGVPFDRSATVWDHYFPQIRLSGLTERQSNRYDRQFDLLLLGGSVLEPAWGDIAERLTQRLEAKLPGRVRVYNLAVAGFTSRDSLLQYRHLEHQRFDLVVVYDGLNDVRLNCCPPELFRDDYTHNARYGGLARRLEAGQISLPAAALSNLQTAWEGMPLGSADPRLASLATDPGSPRALRANLSELSDLARARGDRLLLMSYAWHIPADYTADRFAGGQLDYHTPAPRACGVEMWGRPELVALAMRRQNAAVAELVAGLPDVLWVDQDAQLPHDREHFIDPCHLTPQGCERFVQNLWPVVEPVVDQFARLP